MALTDEQEKELRAQLAESQKRLADLEERAKQEALDKAKKSEEERNAQGKKTEQPVQPKLDPDAVKEIAQLRQEVNELKAKLGQPAKDDKAKASSYAPVNFFGGGN